MNLFSLVAVLVLKSQKVHDTSLEVMECIFVKVMESCGIANGEKYKKSVEYSGRKFVNVERCSSNYNPHKHGNIREMVLLMVSCVVNMCSLIDNYA